MPLQSKHIAYITAGVALTAGLGYIIYFDHKRRNDPNFRKQLKRERKKLAKKEKEEKTQSEKRVKDLIEQVLAIANEEVLPTSAEEKEKYFMEQVAKGEALCTQGPAYYQAAVVPFYLALKVYPAPLELITIYQKTIPEACFQILVTIMATEQNNRVNAFYQQFPDPSTGLTLGELPVGKNAEGKTIVRRGLVAQKDFEEGDVLFSESPLVSALFPSLEGTNCHHCLKQVDETNKTACQDCTLVIYCSPECYEQSKSYHKYLCSKNNIGEKEEGNKESTEEEKEKKQLDKTVIDFIEYAKEKNEMYPLMIAEFLSAMVTEETERTKKATSPDDTSNNNNNDESKTFTSWDHVDRFRYLDIQPSEATLKEMDLLKVLLSPKVQGISEFLSEQIYLMLKGKLLYNAYAVQIATPANEGDLEEKKIKASKEHARTSKHQENESVGAALYKLATYIGQSEKESNTKIVFQKKDHTLSVVATHPIKKGDEIKTHYTLPVSVPETSKNQDDEEKEKDVKKDEEKEKDVKKDDDEEKKDDQQDDQPEPLQEQIVEVEASTSNKLNDGTFETETIEIEL
ncbi:unnamed protein product [Cunninghamella blakesleeana]